MYIVCQIAYLYSVVIILRAISSFFPVSPSSPFAPVVSFLYRVTEPVFAPVRRVMPATGPFDFTPLVVLLVLQLIVPRLLGC
ncbi:MAG: YggT family protein [Actinobacteria bacterium]|jgi:YggT family protein|nr:YggT family protein [Actinomycetota bacterium]NBR67509.1 YggT family protein [Actinomycetota bacterium]NBU16276.1 YggT family protein [Actinomycetota bacterium]